MNDFAEKTEPAILYSYKTKLEQKLQSDFFSSESDFTSDVLAEPDFSTILLNADSNAHRLINGFYPVESGSFRWIAREAELLIDIPDTATHLFVSGSSPEELWLHETPTLSIRIENDLLGEIQLPRSGSFSERMPVSHLERPRRLARLKVTTSHAFVPADTNTTSSDHRELSVTLSKIGFQCDGEEGNAIPKNTQEHAQPFAPYFNGTCIVCGEQNFFTLNKLRLTREAMMCSNCGSTNRIRQLSRGMLKFLRTKGFYAQTIREFADGFHDQELAIYDTDSRYAIARLLRSKSQYVTSDYIPDVEPGTKLGESHFCQDLSKLTFTGGRFDIVLTSDVFEHVRLHNEAFHEIYRVLKPGGVLIFTVPFDAAVDQHHVFVEPADPSDPQKDVYVRPAVYHGDPLQSSGSLLYRIYGKEIFKELEDAGFAVSYERSTHPHIGIFDCDVFYCVKPELVQTEESLTHPARQTARLQSISQATRKTKLLECKLLNIELSSICNLRCRWCVLDHKKPKQFLTLTMLEDILTQIVESNLPDLERIELHNGGETLLHPHIDEALELFAKHRPAFKQQVFISLLTNGTVLKDSTLALLTSGKVVDEIRISIDGGTVAAFEHLRKNAKWPVVAKNVQRIAESIKQAGSKTRLGIICLIPPGKPDNTSWMEKEFRDTIMLADNLEIRYPHTWEGMLETPDLAPADPLKKRKDRVCKFLKHDMVVLASGDVTVCCADLNSRGVVGSLNDEKLGEIYAGTNRRKMIALWKQGRFDEIPICSTCEGYPDPMDEVKQERKAAAELKPKEVRRQPNISVSKSLTEVNTVDPMLKMAERFVRDGKIQQALQTLEQGFGQFKEAAKLHFGVYELLKAENRREEAEFHFTLAQLCDPSLAEVHNEFGVRAFQRGDVGLAQRNFARAVHLNDKFIPAHKNLAELCLHLQKPMDAIPVLQKLISLVPHDVEALRLFGFTCIASDAKEDALFFFTRAAAIDPNDQTSQEMIASLREIGIEVSEGAIPGDLHREIESSKSGRTEVPESQVKQTSSRANISNRQACGCCKSEDVVEFHVVEGFTYYHCNQCEFIFVENKILDQIDRGEAIRAYDPNYWNNELPSARERSYGPALARMAEAFHYSRIPIQRFLDIGTGPGYFLDAVSEYLPNKKHVFYGVELFPPPKEFQTRNPNYIIGGLKDVAGEFDAGLCMEVIEHLTPRMLKSMLADLAAVSNPGALYIFNSSQPYYVKNIDVGYLDPLRRGHIASYSVEAVRKLVEDQGWVVHALEGKSWAFTLEYNPPTAVDVKMIHRIWSALPENLNTLSDGGHRPLMTILGLDAAQAFVGAKTVSKSDARVEHQPVLKLGAPIPTESDQDTGYARKLNAELAQYVNDINVHDLPEISHVVNNASISDWLNELTGESNFMNWWANEINAKLETRYGVVRILSIGCGNGDIELDVIAKTKDHARVRLLGLDVNKAMIARANSMAAERGLSGAVFEVRDLNNLKLDERYDVVLASHSLHHIVELEKLFAAINTHTNDDMTFVVNDMIGRNGHVMWDSTREIVGRIWNSLDRKYKFNAYTKRFDNEPMNHDCSTEGFEGIRAEDVLPLMIEYFDVEMFLPFAGLINRFTDRGYGHNFNPKDKNDVDVIMRLLDLDIQLMREKKISPVQAFMRLRKKGQAAALDFRFQTPDEVIDIRKREFREEDVDWSFLKPENTVMTTED